MISVIIHHSGDRDQFLEEALDSVLNQSERRHLKEVIVLENNKLQKKQKPQKKYNSVIIKHIKLKHYIEPTYLLTLAGLKHAQENYVAYLADDDIWDENHIARSVESFRLRNNVVASFSATIIFMNNGRYWVKPEDSFARHFACNATLGNKMFFSKEDIIVGSLLGPLFHLSTLVTKKDVFYKSLMSIENKNIFDNDRIIPLQITKHGLIVADNRLGALIRRHSAQESARIYSSGEGQKWWNITTTKLLDSAKSESINLRVTFAERMRNKNISLSDLELESNSMGQVRRLIHEGVLVKPKGIIVSKSNTKPKNLIKKVVDYRIDRKIIRPIEQIVKKVRNYIKNVA
ncbi:MAG: glycosyltransferase family 2 protein [Gammaproteobacteria bacterium]|nr:glycosyltransferase family 2 protein [Gammaproteobacteria bacterium]